MDLSVVYSYYSQIQYIQFTSLLKFICKPKLILAVPCCHLLTHGDCQQSELPDTYIFPAGTEQVDTLPSCFSSWTMNKCPFCGLFSATKLCSGKSYWVVGHEVMSRRCVSTKCPWTETPKTWCVLISWRTCCDQRLAETQPFISPSEHVSVFTDLVSAVSLWNIYYC